MANQKLHIEVWLHGQHMGYVKSISYARRRFDLTKDITEAKGYVKEDVIRGDIDACMSYGGMLGYIFTYN